MSKQMKQASRQGNTLDYNESASWHTLSLGVVIWIRSRKYLEERDFAIPDYSKENWVYGHPCVITRLIQHPTHGRWVDVAPVCQVLTPDLFIIINKNILGHQQAASQT